MKYLLAAFLVVSILLILSKAEGHDSWGPDTCMQVVETARWENKEQALEKFESWPASSALFVIRCLVEEIRK